MLPDAKLVVEKVLLRKRFIPDPQGSNLMFAFFAQHFTHQFFKSDFKKGPAFTKALGHGVSLIYNTQQIVGLSYENIFQFCFMVDFNL